MFKMIHDLASLSDSERAQYCRDFASYLGLNPDENRIDTIWMNDNNVRALVAYCRRGTTDILRDIYNIDVTEMIREDGPGYVSYKAVGVNRRGRKEIAVGAFATAGLTGDRLAAAVATAETRAGRRLTLKFMGGGLLDESEVNREPVQITSTPVAAPAIQPFQQQKVIDVKPGTKYSGMVEINNPAINEPHYVPEAAPANVEYHFQIPPHSGIVGVGIPPKPLSEPSELPNSSRVQETMDRQSIIGPNCSPALPPAPVIAIPASVEAANAIIAQDTTVEAIPVKKTRKPRKSKNTVDMGESSVPESPKADIPESQPSATPVPVQQLTYVPICPDCQDFMSANDSLDLYICVKHGRVDTLMKPSVVRNSAPPPPPVAAPVPVDVKPAPPVSQSPLTPEQQKNVKTRLSTFWVYILPEQGGMTSDDGLSINAKLIKYANLFYQNAPNSKEWTFEQWDVFIKTIEKHNAEFGPKALVDHINGVISAV